MFVYLGCALFMHCYNRKTMVRKPDRFSRRVGYSITAYSRGNLVCSLALIEMFAT